MMASNSNRFPKWTVNLFFFLFYLSCAISSASPTSYVKHSRYAHGISRFKRQETECQDGYYAHEGKRCCRCAAGQYLQKHCTTSPEDRICDHCVPGKTYSSTPNSQMTCESCTSCSHVNADQEEEQKCSIARNTVCRCKKDHYCETGKEICTSCKPCQKCDDEGIEVACTATNNAVCKDKKSEGVNLVAVLVPVFVILTLVVLFIWKKEYFTQRLCGKTGDPITPPEVMEPLRGVDLAPHIPKIVKVLGWPVMRNVAMSTGMKHATIQYAEHDHPNDAEERTFQLLTTWVEQQGSEAASKLIEKLREMGKNGIAENVMDIIKKK